MSIVNVVLSCSCVIVTDRRVPQHYYAVNWPRRRAWDLLIDQQPDFGKKTYDELYEKHMKKSDLQKT